METKLPLVVIVGPTASGKTSLSIELAQKYNGEIICADSRTVYKHMDIGTAKPSLAERSLVPHWGLDLVMPNERFTAADFQKYAISKIEEIRSRGSIPFLVGGTGMYIDSVLFNYEFGDPPDVVMRKKLEKMTINELHKYCSMHNISLPENEYNKRYVVRAIEQNGVNYFRRPTPPDNTIIVGITTDRTVLRNRIERRSEQFFYNGVVDEAIMLGKKYGWDTQSMTANIYRLAHEYTEGLINESTFKIKFEQSDWHLAKRQLTWLKRNKFVVWKSLEEAESYLHRVLNEHKS